MATAEQFRLFQKNPKQNNSNPPIGGFFLRKVLMDCHAAWVMTVCVCLSLRGTGFPPRITHKNFQFLQGPIRGNDEFFGWWELEERNFPAGHRIPACAGMTACERGPIRGNDEFFGWWELGVDVFICPFWRCFVSQWWIFLRALVCWERFLYHIYHPKHQQSHLFFYAIQDVGLRTFLCR